MDAIANISFPMQPDYNNNTSQTVSGSTHGLQKQDIGNKDRFQICPKLLKRLLRKPRNSSSAGLDGIGCQELKL
jgi:hypothetical protein